MNLYNELLNLLPQDPLLVGEAVISHADGTTTVELPGGGQVRVRGSAAAGQRVFIRSGQLQGDAPDLPYAEIEE
jgi:hypothetical protein